MKLLLYYFSVLSILTVVFNQACIPEMHPPNISDASKDIHDVEASITDISAELPDAVEETKDVPISEIEDTKEIEDIKESDLKDILPEDISEDIIEKKQYKQIGSLSGSGQIMKSEKGKQLIGIINFNFHPEIMTSDKNKQLKSWMIK